MARFTVSGSGGSGAPGPTGPVGPEGDSAYDVAVANGFVGTEQEWLDSLGGGGNADIADFIFTAEEGQSVMSLPSDRQMRIQAGENSDLYITADDDLYVQATDDLYLQTINTGDDIHINAADDIRFSAGEENETTYFWRMDSEGRFQLPGDGYISNPSSVTYEQNNRVDTFTNNYLNDSTGLNNTSSVALLVDETTMWYVMNQASFTSPVTITFQDSTTVETIAIYDASSQGVPAVIFQWNTGDLVKTFEETFPLNISVAYQTAFYGQDTLVLDPASYGNDQFIIIDPTAPNHIHIRAGGQIDQSSADLILGGEENHVRISDIEDSVNILASNVNINSYTSPSSLNINTYSGAVINSNRTSAYDPEDKVVATLGDIEIAVPSQSLETDDSPSFNQIYVTNNNGTGENVKIGDDAWIGDLNVANYIGITGAQDPTVGGIILGNSGTETISASDGNIYINSGGAMTLNAASGDMNFYMDGGMYIGPADSGNQIIKRSDLNSLPNDYFQSVRWTPNFEATGLTFTGTENTHPAYQSYYVKQGQLVSFWIAVDCSTVTNFGTGQLKLSLPFDPLPGTMNHFSGWVNVDETANPDLAGHIIVNADHLPNTSVLDLHYIKQSGGANSPVMEAMLMQNTPVVLTTNTNIYVNGTYISA